MPIKEDFLKKYFNNVFVETGSGDGSAIQIAANAGFREIYSIELSPVWYKHCQQKFKVFGNVKLIFGDSRFALEQVINKIHEPITFWLDAHCSGGETAGGDIIPIFDEIKIISRHKIKTHTIAIDDMRCCNNQDEMIKELLLINSDYKIIYEDSSLFKNDILVAKV